MNDLIKQAIDSAKCRVYKLGFDLNGNLSAHHQKKAENQKELMEITIKALEKYDAIQRMVARLEEEIDFSTQNYKEDEAIYRKGLRYARRIIKQESGL